MTATGINPPLFMQLSNVLDNNIISFCADQTVLQMLKVCRAWSQNSEVQKAKIIAYTNYKKWENQWGATEGYPLQLLAIFQNCHFSIYRLPELSFDAIKEDFRQRIKQNRQAGRSVWDGIYGISMDIDGIPYLNNDYIDFLNTRLLSAPIMRFKHEGRAGLVLCLQDRTSSKIGICALFRRFTYQENWVEAPVQHNDHRLAPSHLSVKGNVVFDALIPVLSGNDPDVRLIDPPPASEQLSLLPPASPSLINGKILFLSFGKKVSDYIMFEIYVSFLQTDSSWSEPISIGKPVNSDFVDNTIHYGGSFVPYLSPDETTLYFSSFRADSYGECDIYMSRRIDSTFLKWSEPINLGGGVNSTGWDAYFSISAKGDYAYFVSDKNSFGQEDIMRIKITDTFKPKSLVLVYGSVFDEKTVQLLNATVEYQQDGNINSLKKLNFSPADSVFKIFLTPGYQFLFTVTAPHYLTKSVILDLKDITNYKEHKLDFFLSSVDTQKVYILENIYFDFDKAELKPESFPELDKLIKFLLENPELKIEIGGHTDNIGTKEYNLQLSLARAEAVANYLIGKGIDRKRIEVLWFGDEQPIAPNDTEENRQKNRRVEFKLKKGT